MKNINIDDKYTDLVCITQDDLLAYITCYDNQETDFCLCEINKQSLSLKIIERNKEYIGSFVNKYDNTWYYYFDVDEFNIVVKNINGFEYNAKLELSTYEGNMCNFICYKKYILFGQRTNVRLFDTKELNEYIVPSELSPSEVYFYQLYEDKIIIDKSTSLLYEVEDTASQNIIECFQIDEFIKSIKDKSNLLGNYIFECDNKRYAELIGILSGNTFLRVLRNNQYSIFKNDILLFSISESATIEIIHNQYLVLQDNNKIYIYNDNLQLLFELDVNLNFEYNNTIQIIDGIYIAIAGYLEERETIFLYNVVDRSGKYYDKNGKIYILNNYVF